VAEALHRHYPTEAAVEAIALDLDPDETQAEAVFDPFGGGSKDALEAFFGSSGESPQTAEPAPEPPAPAAAAAKAAPQAKGAAAQGASTRAPAAAEGRATGPGPRAAPPPATPPAGSAAARSAPAAAQRAAPPAADRPAPRRVELELEELTPGPGRPISAPAQETTGTAEFTLTDEITGSGLLIPEEAPPAPAPSALTPRELEVLHALERLAGGAHAEPEILKPAQAMAALALLLVKKGIVTEQELLAAITRR
jgi:hypothetical protein